MCHPYLLKRYVGKITRLGNRKYINSFDTRVDPWGRVYYWLGGDVVDEEDTAGHDTDVANDQGK